MEQDAAIIDNLKRNGKSADQFKAFLNTNPDLVDRGYLVDSGTLMWSVLNRYIHQRAIVSVSQVYPVLTPALETMRKIMTKMRSEKKSK